MGRLTKLKIDRIVKLRNDDYTQKEIAEKEGLNIRTVRKYDPLRQGIPNNQQSVEDRVRTLEKALRACWDWIDLLTEALLNISGVDNEWFNKRHLCPRCNGIMKYNPEKGYLICHECGHKVYHADNWCYHCLSQQSNYIEETDEWICPKCKTDRYTPLEE